MADPGKVNSPAPQQTEPKEPFPELQTDGDEHGVQADHALAVDKEDIGTRQDWQEIKIADVGSMEEPNGALGDSTDATAETASEGTGDAYEQMPQSPLPPAPPAKDLPEDTPSTPGTGSVGALPSAGGPGPEARSRSVSESTTATRKSTTPLSSIIFVVSALEQIADSKEARKRKALGEAVQKALGALKQREEAPDPEIIFEPLKLATETSSIPLTTTALDCIGKLISYSYFLVHDNLDQVPLIDRAIETICDCFQDEATPVEVQLQILKSLLAAVLNDKMIVHGSGLLKAVRQVYNIFLMSKSSANQQVAQGTLSQMVGTVFERVTTRLSMKETRRLKSADTANTSQSDLTYETLPEPEDVVESVSDQPVPKEPGERLTLRELETAQSFDDQKIGDNAPTTVTPAKSGSKSGRSSRMDAADGFDEEEEDEIFVKDAFLVFRSMCRLSTKELSQSQQQDLKSTNMRSKLVSLAIIRTILNNNMVVFTSPLCTIQGSANGEPTSFGLAINQYLRLSVSRNGASSVRQVFEICSEIFWLMLKDMRLILKREIELFLKEIYLAILERKNAPGFQKLYVMKILRRLSSDPRALVEMYLNYDCESTALDNMFQRIIEHLSRLATMPALVTIQQQQTYYDQYSKDNDQDWQDHGKLPPALTTTSLSAPHHQDGDISIDFTLKRQALECLVRALRAMINWADSVAVANMDGRNSIEQFRESIDGAPVSPRPSAADTAPSTPLLEDDPGQLEKAKLRKTAFDKGVRQFNFKPKKGIKLLLKDGFIATESPVDIANFILQTEALDKAMIGEYLGEGDADNVATMHAFVDSMDFTRRRFVDALRQFLQSFRLPGEAQKIDRFMLKFAERYITGNPNAFANADTAYVLAYSVIMLNTDQHSSKVKKRMTIEDFIKNNRGINDNENLPDEYLHGIFDEIAHNEIVLSTEREQANAAGTLPPAPVGGIASRVGQAFLTAGRDLQREAYAQASEEMSRKAEQRLRNMIKSQRKTASRTSQIKFIPATSSRHIGPMFDVTWMSFFSGLSAQMQTTHDAEVIRLCMEGMRLAIRIACVFDLDTPRTAFITALAGFTNLGNISEMVGKNLEALKILLEIALTESNMLKGSWRDILMCVSQLDRFQLISGGVDEEALPDVSRGRVNGIKKSAQKQRSNSSNSNFHAEVANESRSTDMVKITDRIFTGTADMSGDAIVHFVRALSDVSWQEIQSSGNSDSPRMYSLQKLVEISYYNMTRVRFEWSNIWQVLGEHFNLVGCHSNTNVVFFALDSLRQLSMRFMELEELPGFKFQKDFLKPFEHVIANSAVVPVKDMVLRCLIQMIQARGQNIRSGWKTMFGVFTVAAREPYEAIVNLAFEYVTKVYAERFGVIVSQGAFADLVVCFTAFSKNLKFQKKSLAAIETLKSTVPRMMRTPECPLSHKSDANKSEIVAVTRQTQEEQFWFPVLFAFHDILMTGDDLEVRSQASNYLFDVLKEYGGDFPPDFWDVLWRQILHPIFMVLRSNSEMKQVLNHEDLSVWLSTTMIQALRNMITLFTHYFNSLEYMLDRFLDLLALCICQENDTIARIGSNCLQQLILQNVSRFKPEHWGKIVGCFVELFDRTTAYQLFHAVSSPSDSSSVADTSSARKSSIPDTSNAKELSLAPDTGVNGDGRESPDTAHLSPLPEESTGDDLEDYRPQSGLQQQPVVVTAARRKYFNKIITRCVLQLLMIETVNELFSNDAVYAQIPSTELLRLMGLLKSSYNFAKRFNNNKDLRMRLWREGFMKQPPNLLKQESGSAACYVNILVRMYHDEGEERRKNRAATEAALIPLCADIIRSFNELDESQPRNIEAWRPVVVDVMEGYINFPREDFERHIDTFYPLGVDLLNRETGYEIRLALQTLLRRTGEVRMGLPPPTTPVQTPQTPTSPRSVNSAYFMNRRGSRGR